MATPIRTILITGATSGIGEATAKKLAQNSFNLILCGRREDRLNTMREQLSSHTKVITRCFDIQNQSAVKKAIESLPDEWKAVDVLINNAGNAHGLESIQNGSIQDWDNMIDSNIKGLLYLSKEIIPIMIARKSGHLVNIGSIAGKEVYENGNVYCATKFAVDAITRGMRIDLNPYGIKVTAIHPGMVETEFSLVRFKGDKERAQKVYAGFTPLFAADIADTIWYAISRPPHVVIADLVVMPTAQASATVVKRNS